MPVQRPDRRLPALVGGTDDGRSLRGLPSTTRANAFLHSHSYTGNPIARAAALATLDIFESDDVLARNRGLAQCMARHAARVGDHACVADTRQTGTIVAFELAGLDASKRPGLAAYRHALERGAALRPLGEVLYWMPPYCLAEDELELLAEVTRSAIEEVARTCA